MQSARVLLAFSFLSFIPFVHAQTCTPTGTAPSVTICSPTSGSTVSSPVTIVATANSTKTVQFTQIYIDGIKAYQVSGADVNTQLSMGTGQHRLTVQAYDGTYIKQTEYITVSSGGSGGNCVATGTAPSVTICSPSNGATVDSPVTISAAANSTKTVQYLQVYIDGNKAYQANGSSVDTQLSLAAGKHRLTVTAYDGSSFWYTEYFTVGSSGGGGGSCTATGSAPSVTICAPANGATVDSPVTISAAANSTKTVQYLQVYIDGTKQYQANGSSVDTQLSLPSGQHRLTVTAYDGSSFWYTENFTVGSGGGGGGACTPSSTTPSVKICTPVNGATVDSPVTITAAANSTKTIQFSQIYIDGAKQYQVNGANVDTQLTMGAGQHRVTVQAYDGSYFHQTEYITVGTGGGSGGGPCTLNSTDPSVTICEPADNATVDSPVHVVAGTTSSKSVSYTQIYVDYVKAYQVSGGNVDTYLDLAAGTHRISVQAYNGSYFKSVVNITVGSGTNPPPPSGSASSFTYKYDNMRTGLNDNETTLTTSNVNVNSFGKIGTWTLDGTAFAQPLYWAGLDISGKGTHNVLFVATEHDTVFALDADHPGSAPLWKKNFLVNGATTVPASSGGRTGLGTEVGITGTPVIDENTGTLYVSAMTMENNVAVHRLHALDVHTGQEKSGSPVKITATVNGIGSGHDANNQITFNSLRQNQRPALLLSNGVVYVSFAAFSDVQPYHGWVFAFDASTLQKLSAWIASPDTEGAGIWMAGAGPAADSNGNIYLNTGDGTYQSGDLGDSFIKLKLVNGSLQMVDYFTPFNEHCLNADDLDLGSTGPLLVPDNASTRHLVISGSKEGRIYVVDRDNMGHKQSGSDSQIIQSILVNPTACGASGFSSTSSHRFYGGAAYWNGNVYLGAIFGPLYQYHINSDGTITKVATGPTTYTGSGQTGRGPIPTASSNGNSNGIVWLLNRNYSTGDATLYAYDGSNIAKLLYSSGQNSSRDAVGFGTGFAVPLVINGRVYASASHTIKVYGLLK